MDQTHATPGNSYGRHSAYLKNKDLHIQAQASLLKPSLLVLLITYRVLQDLDEASGLEEIRNAVKCLPAWMTDDSRLGQSSKVDM
jgi:hypothetical protein